MIRVILVVLFVVLFLILSIPLLIAEWIIGKFNPSVKDRSSLAIVSWGLHQVERLAGTEVTVIGMERIPADTAVLYTGNHRSFFDIILTYHRMPGLTGYVAKKELRSIPLLSHWMKNLHCLFLDRKNIKEGLKTVLTAIEKVRSGISVFIFPEGTRNKVNDTFLPFHDGSFKIAVKGDVPIVPVTIVNSAAVLEDHFPRIKRARVVIEFGEPIRISALDKENAKHISTYVADIISETYFRNKHRYFS